VRIFTLIFIAGACLAPAHAFAQETGGAPTFEVATVKPADLMAQDRLGIGLFTYPGGRIVANKCPLDYLIEQAFNLQRFQIAGAPGWAHGDRFNIEAKPPASSQSSQSNPNNPKLPPNQEQRQMLQALLMKPGDKVTRGKCSGSWETPAIPPSRTCTFRLCGASPLGAEGCPISSIRSNC
jgi:Protein of unknown function (DUF3738)